MTNQGNLFFDGLTKVSNARSGRASSWDQSGRNQDYWMIPPQENIVLCDLEGPGCITHIWMTSFSRIYEGPGLLDPHENAQAAPVNEIHNALGLNRETTDPFYFRKVLIKMTWDDQDIPSVLVPLGDFFGIGDSRPSNFTSLPFNVSVKPSEDKLYGAQCSMSCYLPMPFGKKARIEVVNENERPLGLYFYIDYELYSKPLEADTAYFHASWHRECPCTGWGNELQVNSPEVNSVSNLSGDENYVILETQGRGHYIGCNLTVRHFQGSWWGEGDDMIFIDGEKQASILGTGTEDYFNHAWGMQKNQFPFFGSIIHESETPGLQVSYRFHIPDPVRFSDSIKVTIEHGHANQLSDDWSSTAYWYQTLPSPKLSILPVSERLPLVPYQTVPEVENRGIMAEDVVRAREKTRQRAEIFFQKKQEALKQKQERTRKYEQGNFEQSRELRQRFDMKTKREGK